MTFARGTKVSLVNLANRLTLEGEVANDMPTVTTIDVKIGGTTQPFSFVRDEWRITEIRDMPTGLGAVIQITKWHSSNIGGRESSHRYLAMLTNGGWHIACDRAASYSQDMMRSYLNAGAMDFEIIYEPAAPPAGGADTF